MTREIVTVHAFRALPGQDLKREIERFVHQQKIEAGWISCCVGSLTQLHLRFANRKGGSLLTVFFEILSLSGTVSIHGSDLHMAVNDQEGLTLGGHLLEDNLVYTTAEIVISASHPLRFRRENDTSTGWQELFVEKKEPE